MKRTDRRPVAGGRLNLTAFGLGGAALGGLYQASSAADAQQTLAAAWEAGLRYFDTAPYYGCTRSERRIGDFLSAHAREDFVLSTKVGRLMLPDTDARPTADGWVDPLPFRPHFDYRYSAIMRSFEDSLQRLGLARIDIILVHDIGRMTHGGEHEKYWRQLTQEGGFRALEELRADGRVGAVGLGVNEWQIVHDSMQETQIDCTLLAGRYTLLEQTCLTPLLEDCLRHGNAVVIGAPFNSGILVGGEHYDYARAPADVVRRVEGLKALCADFDVPLPAAALQFPMAHPAVVSCVTGVRTPAELRQNIRWFEQPIPPELWQALRASRLIDASAPCPGDVARMPSAQPSARECHAYRHL